MSVELKDRLERLVTTEKPDPNILREKAYRRSTDLGRRLESLVPGREKIAYPTATPEQIAEAQKTIDKFKLPREKAPLSTIDILPTAPTKLLGPRAEPSERMQIGGYTPTLWEQLKWKFERPEPAGGWDRSDRPLRTFGQLATHITADTISGLGLHIPDILAKKITGEQGLSELVDKVTGFKPTPGEIRAGEAAQFIGGLQTVGGVAHKLVAKIAARRALQIILGAGITFGGRRATEEVAEKIISNKPFDWQGIHFESGIGVLWGAGEVGLIGFARFARGFTAKIRGKTPVQIRAARAEVDAAIKNWKATGDRTQWDAVRVKYAGITPEGAARIKARTPVPVRDFGKYPLARAEPPVDAFAMPTVPAPSKPLLGPRKPVAPIIPTKGAKVPAIQRMPDADLRQTYLSAKPTSPEWVEAHKEMRRRRGAPAKIEVKGSEARKIKQKELQAESSALASQAYSKTLSFKPTGRAGELAQILGVQPKKGQVGITIYGTTYSFRKTSAPTAEQVKEIESLYRRAEEIQKEIGKYGFATLGTGQTTGNKKPLEQGIKLREQGLLDKEELDYLSRLEDFWKKYPNAGYGIVQEDGSILPNKPEAKLKPPVTPAEGKQPWEMTKAEFTRKMDTEWNVGKNYFDKEKQIGNIRREIIKDALSEDKPVPAEVLAEYSDLAKQATIQPPVAAPAEGKVKSYPVNLPYTYRKDFEQLFQFMPDEEIKALPPLVRQWRDRLIGAAGKEPIYSTGQAYKTTIKPEMHKALTTWAKQQLVEHDTGRENSATLAAKGMLKWLGQNQPSVQPPVAVEGKVEKKYYTSVPDDWRKVDTLFDWGNKGLRAEFMQPGRGGKGIKTDGRKRKTFIWQGEFEELPIGTPRKVLNAINARTDEVFEVKKREGRFWKLQHRLVPKTLIKELKAEMGEEAFAIIRKPKVERPKDLIGRPILKGGAAGVQAEFLEKKKFRLPEPDIVGQMKIPEVEKPRATKEQQRALDEFLGHVRDPKMASGKAIVPIPQSVQKSLQRTGERAKHVARNISDDIDKFKFYPKAPPEFRNAVRTDLIGALTKATKNVYQDAQRAIWGDLNKRDVQKSVEILYARDQLSRTRLNKGNPEIGLRQAREILDKTLKDASPEAIAAADRFKAVHDEYTKRLIERGVLEEGQTIEDHVRHYVTDYTPEWAPYANIPTRLKRPFRGYVKKAVGTRKEYRQDQESLLASLMEMEHHNLVEDFVETQVKRYDIKPSLSKEVRRKMFGTDSRGYAKVPRPGRIYIHEGKRYRAYTPDIPFSRAIYMTEHGEAALGSFKNVALIPEDIYNLFRDFSERGSRAIYLLNRATSYWKTMAILAHFPSFNVNNLVGDTWVALVQHPTPLALLEEYQTAFNYVLGDIKKRPRTGYMKRLEEFITKHDIMQTFTQVELSLGRKSKNPIAWLLRKTYSFSDHRESFNRTAYASSMLKALQRGAGPKMVKAHNWIDTEALSTEDALGKISREVLVDYAAQSKTFRRFVRGGVAPFGTWYFKMSKTIWRWFRKHPFKGLLTFMALPIAATAYNHRRKEIQDLEMKLPDYIRNRVHFILGENPDGTVRVLSLQIPQDVLIGTKIFSIVADHVNRVINGELKPKEAAIRTMKEWGISEYEGAKYLLTPWIRMYAGLKAGKDPYDKAPVYRRDYNKMTWDEKAKDISAYILKTAVPFLGYTIQTYEKGLPQDVAFRKIADRLAGKGAFGIYDMNKKGQVVMEHKGKKGTFEWEDVFKINKLTAREYKWLGRLEDDFVASGKKPMEFLGSEKAISSLMKIYDAWSERVPELEKITDQKERLTIVVESLGERLTNRVTTPRVLSKWFQVQISRAKTDEEKRKLAKGYHEVQKARLLELLKTKPKSARTIELIRKVKELD